MTPDARHHPIPSGYEARFEVHDHGAECYVRTMSLTQLSYFIAVAEEQHLTRAALRLHISQPPLTRQIRGLEDELGVTLFERTCSGMRLLPPGRRLLAEARQLLERIETIGERINTAEEPPCERKEHIE